MFSLPDKLQASPLWTPGWSKSWDMPPHCCSNLYFFHHYWEYRFLPYVHYSFLFLQEANGLTSRLTGRFPECSLPTSPSLSNVLKSPTPGFGAVRESCVNSLWDNNQNRKTLSEECRVHVWVSASSHQRTSISKGCRGSMMAALTSASGRGWLWGC